jgi:Na+-transporting NADH:ubiquinone oxidoreductase subunit NqrD
VLATDSEAYAVKKKVLPVFLDGFGIGAAFTAILALLTLARDLAGKKLFAGKALLQMEPFAFLATMPGILMLTAVAVLCIGLVTARRKKEETPQ